ncbi:MAG: prepilin peptidase [Phycisphaerae bacterium]|nr:prepilin peptidase [Phycisphaerae bacterium]
MHVVRLIFVAAFGACIGSFLNVVIWRLPRGLSIVFPGSHCPCCGRAIRWYDNVPIFSWLLLQGRCRFCGVGISPRYLCIESFTALLLVGLYAAYYVLPLRGGMGQFEDTWPIFLAHATLLCGLLACSAIDLESYHVPLEVCWLISLVGLAAATVRPDAKWMPEVSQPVAAACLGAAVGLAISNVLMHYGFLQPSFLDADPHPRDDEDEGNDVGEHPGRAYRVAMTAACGVRPRVEMLRELLFLAPAILAAAGAYWLVTHCAAAGRAWAALFALSEGRVGVHLNGLFAAVFGYLIGGLWIWGMRIFGTVLFGREAMGLGDAHLLAAAGAAAGWKVPTMAFFLAPIFGLLWALWLLARRGQRELPYGPWLSAGVAAALIFHDRIARLLDQFGEAMNGLF